MKYEYTIFLLIFVLGANILTAADPTPEEVDNDEQPGPPKIENMMDRSSPNDDAISAAILGALDIRTVRMVWKHATKAEKAEFMRLCYEDVDAFRKAIINKDQEFKAEFNARRQLMQTLIDQYKTANKNNDTALAKEIFAKIEDEFRIGFNRNLQEQKEALSEMRHRLEKLEKNYEFRSKNADKIVRKHAKFVIEKGLPDHPDFDRNKGANGKNIPNNKSNQQPSKNGVK